VGAGGRAHEKRRQSKTGPERLVGQPKNFQHVWHATAQPALPVRAQPALQDDGRRAADAAAGLLQRESLVVLFYFSLTRKGKKKKKKKLFTPAYQCAHCEGPLVRPGKGLRLCVAQQRGGDREGTEAARHEAPGQCADRRAGTA